MSISSSSSVTDKIVAPASETNNVSTKVKQEFNSTYNTIYARRDKETDYEKGGSEAITQSKDQDDTEEITAPEIFLLLESYRFEDFFELALSEDQWKLNMAIKKNRKLRGVSQFLPISEEHNNNDEFTNRIENQYLNASWLMKSKPGQSYNAVW